METITGYKQFKSDEDKLKVYSHRLDASDRLFDKLRPKVEDWLNRYRNLPREEEYAPDGHRITVPVGIGIIDAMYASLTATDVTVTVRNVGTGSRAQALLAETGIREVWRETKTGRKAAKAIKDSLISGLGVVKVGYEYAEETREVGRSEDAIAADVDTLFNAAEAEGATLPTPDQIAAVVPSTETQQVAVRDRIVVDYVPWDEIRFDTTAKAWEDVRWVAQVTRLPVDVVKNNPLYREYVETQYGRKKLKDLDALEADATVEAREVRTVMEGDEDDDRITIVRFYDLQTGTACTFPRHKPEFILDETPNPFAVNDDIEDRNPFVGLILREDPGEVIGISEFAVMAPTLDELTEYRSNLATYIARTVPKVLGPAGALTQNGKEALMSPEWGAYVEYEGANGTDIMPLTPPPLPQEVFGIPQRLENELREATGVSELMRGLFPDRKRTATETMAVTEQSTIRQAEKRNKLEQFYVDIARRVLMLMQLFYDAPRISRVVEMEGDVEWEWSAEDVTMEAQLEVSLSPKEAYTSDVRRDFALSMFNLLAPIPTLDINAMVKWMMEEAGIPLDVIRTFLRTAEEQQQQAMEQLQMQSAEQSVAAGEGVDPNAVPGPMSGEDLAAAANPGAIPPEVAAALAFSRTRPVTPEA